MKRLRRPYRSKLEKLLSIFFQELALKNKHALELDESVYPEPWTRLLRRLHRAWEEREVRETMDVEDDMLEELEARERQLQDREEVIREQGKALEEKDKALEEQDKTLEEKARLIKELKRKLGGS